MAVNIRRAVSLGSWLSTGAGAGGIDGAYYPIRDFDLRGGFRRPEISCWECPWRADSNQRIARCQLPTLHHGCRFP
jgi:hypothetical protein